MDPTGKVAAPQRRSCRGSDEPIGRTGETTHERRPAAGGQLLVLDCAYSLAQIRQRGMEHVVTRRDIDGFFDHVWYVQPLLGADARAGEEKVVGPVRETELSTRHTVVECPLGRVRLLRRATAVNVAVAQLMLFVRLNRLVRGHRIRVVTVTDPFYLGLLGLALARLHRLPVVVDVNANYDTIHESTGKALYARLLRSRRLERRIARFVLARADLVTVGSDDNMEYVLGAGAGPERVGSVLTGDMIAEVHLEPPAERSSVDREAGLVGRPFMAIVGRLEPSKLPDASLHVLAALKRSVPTASLLIVGEGSMRADLERQASELGLSDDVRIVGTKDQAWIARALSSAAVVLCPYSGLALVEAALSGTPIVGYDVEWHAEAITSGENGLLVPFGDIDALADAVRALFTDEATGRALAHAARQRALREMNRAAALDARRAVYASLLRERPA